VVPAATCSNNPINIPSYSPSLGSGGVFLTSLGLIAFGLAIKSDFSQFQSFFSKDSIEERGKGR
jgi:hypothetical protein